MPVHIFPESISPAPALCRFAASAVAAAFRLPGPEAFRMPRRAPAGLRARRCAMYLAHVGLGQSQKRVARAFRRDPAVVRQGCARIEDARDCRTFDRALTHLEFAGRAWAQAFLGLNAGGAR